MKSSEFQAIVLAGGKGSRMMDLTHSKAKCFLPIGNYPMVWYPLNMLQNIGFKEVIVVTHDWAKDEMNNLPKKYGLDLQLTIVTISDNEDLGTAEALRKVHNKIGAETENLMVVSSDLLVEVKQIRHLTDLHRVHRSSVTALFSPTESKQIVVPGPKSKERPEKDLVGIDHNNNQLCFLSSFADLNESISLKRSLLREHPSMTVHSNLLDAHFYIFEKWIADFLYNDRDFTAIKGELLPYLVRQQYRLEKQFHKDHQIDEETPNHKAAAIGQGLERFLPSDDMAIEAQNLSSWNDHSGDLKDAYRNRQLRCYAHVMGRGGICSRVNTLMSYCDVNRQIQQLWPLLASEREMTHRHPSAKIQPKAVVSPDCLIGDETYLSDKTTTTGCLIGSHCKIEEKVKLTNCIIMDRVTIKSGCNLQGLIICDDVIVEERCEIKDSIIGQKQVVKTNAKISNEVICEDEEVVF